MPKSSNQKLKLLYLSRIFLEQTDSSHAMTIKELSSALAKYEVRAERKSLYDDIELLRVFGLDICVVRDRQVRYYVGKHTFELAELKLLLDAVHSSEFISEKKSNSLIKKLEGLSSKYDAARLHKQLSATNVRKTANEEIFCNVDMIHRAMSENRRICFRYFVWTPEKKRELQRGGEYYCVSPWALVWESGRYCMLAFDSEERAVKKYRIDKMMELYMDKSTREGEASFDTYRTDRTFGTDGEDLVGVRLSCERSMADVMIDRFGTDIIIAKDGERFEFTVKVAAGQDFCSWILSFGDKVRIVYPEQVRQRVASLAREVLDSYGEQY